MHTSALCSVRSLSGIIHSFQLLDSLVAYSLMSCSPRFWKIGERFPEKIRANCSSTLSSTSLRFVIKFPCSSLIDDRLPTLHFAFLTSFQNCFWLTLAENLIFSILRFSCTISLYLSLAFVASSISVLSMFLGSSHALIKSLDTLRIRLTTWPDTLFLYLVWGLDTAKCIAAFLTEDWKNSH